MNRHSALKYSAFLGALLLAGVVSQAQAQGVIGGAAEGSRQGAHAAGPIGGVIGGVVGGVTGGIAGLLGVDQRHRFHDYVVREHHPYYRYDGAVVVGADLPRTVTYYDLPPEYGVSRYRYALVNGHTVLVDPRDGRIVQIID